MQIAEHRKCVGQLNRELRESMLRGQKFRTRTVLEQYRAAIESHLSAEELASFYLIQECESADRFQFEGLNQSRNRILKELSQMMEQFETFTSEDFSSRFEAFSTMYTACDRDGQKLVSAITGSHVSMG